MKNGPYILIKAPEKYPGKKYRGRYAYEHHVVWWQAYGEVLKAGEVLHHLNGNKQDNRIENLQKHSAADHAKIHAADNLVLWVILYCDFCGCQLRRTTRDYRSKLKQGQHNFFCCRRHQIKQQHLNRSRNNPMYLKSKGPTC